MRMQGELLARSLLRFREKAGRGEELGHYREHHPYPYLCGVLWSTCNMHKSDDSSNNSNSKKHICIVLSDMNVSCGCGCVDASRLGCDLLCKSFLRKRKVFGGM